MKYIIDIEDEPLWRQSALHGEDTVFKAKGFNALVFDKHGLDKLTPLDMELDEAYQSGFEAGSHEATTLEYQQGLDDAWEMAKRIALVKIDKNCPYFTVAELKKIFGCSTYQSVFDTYSAPEAIEKVKAHEQQKADAEIVAGDEVKNTLELMNNAVGYFIEPTNNEYYRVLRYVNGKIDIVAWNKENCVKTGKHSDAVVQLLAEMKGKQRNCSTCKHLCVNSIECAECYSSKGYNRWEPKEGVE